MPDDPKPPSYDGPQPLHLPRASPTPKASGVSETPSGLYRVLSEDFTKAKRASRYRVYSAVGAGLLTILGGGTIAKSKGETLETKAARLEERQASTEKAVEKLTVRADAGEKAQQHTALKLERVEALLELELDMHNVPKAKRPPKVEEPEP